MPVSLYDAIKASYEPNKKAKERMIKKDYVLIDELSNHNQKVFFNPKNKKVIIAGAGTHNIQDIGTDLYLAVGKLKDTNRYKEAKQILEKTRKLIPSAKSINIAGHSLYGSIASGIGKKGDNIITYNKGATIGQKTRQNEKAIRTSGDIVSILANDTQTLDRTVKNLRHKNDNHSVPTFFKSHNVENLKKANIYVDDTPKYSRPIYNPNDGDGPEFQNYSLN